MKKLILALLILLPVTLQAISVKETRTGEDITFITKSGTDISVKARVTAAGNVGIGTNNPTGKLDVQGGDVKIGNITINGTGTDATITTTGGDITINGVKTLTTNQYLTSTDFPNTTGLYGWKANTSGSTFIPSYGSVVLDINNPPLTSSNNHLGDSRTNTFGGSVYLSSTNNVFDSLTNTFSLGIWVYRSNWSTNFNANSDPFISKFDGTNGFIFRGKNSSPLVHFIGYSSGSGIEAFSFNASSLPAGWHHFVVARSFGSYTALYIDGLLLSKTSTAVNIGSVTDKFEIGSYNGGAVKTTGLAFEDIWVDIDTVWTSDQVKRIYARGSMRQASIANDGKIDMVLPLEGKWFSYTPTPYAASGIPTFTTMTGYYSVTNNVINFHAYLDGDAGTDGSGGQNFFILGPIVISPVIYYNGSGYAKAANYTPRGAAIGSYFNAICEGNSGSLYFKRDDTGGLMDTSLFGNGARTLSCHMTHTIE